MAADFVTGVARSQTTQEVQKVSEIKTYLTQYVDGAGKQQVRIVFMIPGSNLPFIMNERVGTQLLVTEASGWFKEGFTKMLSESTRVESL